MLGILLLLFTSTPSLASQEGSVEVSEYHRLHDELDRLAEKRAWVGVERTWKALVDTGVEPTDEDRILAAHGALALGDLTAARERLLVVAKRTEDRGVIETLFRIDNDYGYVTLAGAHELVQETKPFLPEAAAASERATTEVAETGRFEGYLPPGRYRFGYDVIEVVAGEVVELELAPRSRRGKRRSRRTW